MNNNKKPKKSEANKPKKQTKKTKKTNVDKRSIENFFPNNTPKYRSEYLMGY